MVSWQKSDAKGKENLIGWNCISKWIWVGFGFMGSEEGKKVSGSSFGERFLRNWIFISVTIPVHPQPHIAAVKSYCCCWIFSFNSTSCYLKTILDDCIEDRWRSMKWRLIEFFCKSIFFRSLRDVSSERLSVSSDGWAALDDHKWCFFCRPL